MRSIRPARVALVALCVLTGVWLILPTLVALPVSLSGTRSFQLPPQGWSGQWYEKLFADPRWMESLSNSLQIAVLTTVVATVTGTAAALALDRSTFRGRT